MKKGENWALITNDWSWYEVKSERKKVLMNFFLLSKKQFEYFSTRISREWKWRWKMMKIIFWWSTDDEDAHNTDLTLFHHPRRSSSWYKPHAMQLRDTNNTSRSLNNMKLFPFVIILLLFTIQGWTIIIIVELKRIMKTPCCCFCFIFSPWYHINSIIFFIMI